MTITQTVEIPADRRITFNLPREIPTGTTAHFELIWFPVKNTSDDIDDTLERIRELCKDAPISVDSFREERRRDLEMEEAKFQRYMTGSGDSN